MSIDLALCLEQQTACRLPTFKNRLGKGWRGEVSLCCGGRPSPMGIGLPLRLPRPLALPFRNYFVFALEANMNAPTTSESEITGSG